MRLREWLDREGPGAQARLERTAPIAHSTLSRIVNGLSTPKVETAKAIEAATGGEVTAAELLGIDVADGSEAA